VWLTANCVSGGDDIALEAQALTVIIDSAVTLPAVRNNRLVRTI
jgi:hypothetical protein